MRVNVIGAGYVGLVTGAGLGSLGARVCLVEQQADRRAAVLDGRAPFHEPGLDDLLARLRRDGRLDAVTAIDQAPPADVWFIAVGTPSVDDRIDLSAVLAAAEGIGRAVAGTADRTVVVVRSTVVPGTTDGPVRARLAEAVGEPLGDRVALCAQPEFLREGTALDDFRRPDRIVIGGDEAWARERVAALVAPLGGTVIHTTTTNAEAMKYASNALLATLVSFANEIAALCERIPGADAHEVLSSVCLDRRWQVDGRQPELVSYLRAGAGFGGSCLPKDVEALASAARERGVEPWLLQGVLLRNRSRPPALVELCRAVLGHLGGRTVAVLGLAFKPGSDDLRRSPSLDLVGLLAAAGAQVRAHDPLAAGAAAALVPAGVRCFDDLEACVTGADAAVVATAWPEYRTADWSRLADLMVGRDVVDGRDALRDVPLPPALRRHTIGRTPDLRHRPEGAAR